MNSEPFDFDDPSFGGGGGDEKNSLTANPLLFVHRRLRGRYRFAVPLALILAAPLAFIGYNAMEPNFQSTGLIQVRPSLPKLLYTTEQNEVPPLFNSFMQAQVNFLESRRVLDRAAADPRLREHGWPAGPAGVARLQDSLRVNTSRGSQVITVAVSDRDPRRAQAAVNAVLAAYQEIYGEQGELSTSQKERQLVEREAMLDRELQSLRERIFQIADEYGADTLEKMHASRIAEMERLDAELTQLNFLIADARQRASVMDASGENAEVRPEARAAEQAAAIDSQLSQLLGEELRLTARIDSLSERYGPNHREMKRLRERLEEVRAAIDLRTDAIVSAGAGAAVDAAALAASDPQAALAQLEARKKQYESIYERAQREAVSLGRKKLQIASLNEEASETKSLLDETRRRLESIRVEASANQTGRVVIAQRGDLPVSPSRDRRRFLAMGGAAVGVGFSFGLFFLIGFFRDGYRYIDELEDIEDSAPLLGTLPDLSAGELANDEVAALAVHHLRNMLQLRDGRKERAVYTITSATSGDGKTSLALALGMSFAVSGRRTILVDADLVGRGLTHELGLEGLPGLCQAVESRSLNGEAHATRIEDLSALPCGDTARFEPEQLSQRGLGAVIEQLREQYEIVIIDTGPILGSLEANLVSVLSDGVVLTVSRGRSPKLVSASIERLKRIGGRCSGLVFNKAAAKDLERSVSHLSFASASVRSQPREGREAGSGRSGVLLRAVGRPGLPETEAQPSSKAS